MSAGGGIVSGRGRADEYGNFRTVKSDTTTDNSP